jgi:hypothetical protein
VGGVPEAKPPGKPARRDRAIAYFESGGLRLSEVTTQPRTTFVELESFRPDITQPESASRLAALFRRLKRRLAVWPHFSEG